MAQYRVYSLDKYGRIGLAEEISAADDEQAILMAEEINSNALQWEVWDGHRLVVEVNVRRSA